MGQLGKLGNIPRKHGAWAAFVLHIAALLFLGLSPTQGKSDFQREQRAPDKREAPDARQGAQPKKCLLVTSYHVGFEWNDKLEQAVRGVLRGKCELRQFDMDTKRNADPAFAERQALEAKKIIDDWKPDVVITADDNAAKYLLMKHFKNSDIPFVFCGINWSAEEYGLPYRNATGMIEVNMIHPLVHEVKRIYPHAKRGVCLGVDNETDRKMCQRISQAYARESIDIQQVFVRRFHDWIEAYLSAQRQGDFVLLMTNAGINDWDKRKAIELIQTKSSRLVVGVADYMLPYTMLAFTHLAEEQGEYAASVALKILEGVTPEQIPVVTNRKWNIYLNEPLLAPLQLSLPPELIKKAEKVRD